MVLDWRIVMANSFLLRCLTIWVMHSVMPFSQLLCLLLSWLIIDCNRWFFRLLIFLLFFLLFHLRLCKGILFVEGPCNNISIWFLGDHVLFIRILFLGLLLLSCNLHILEVAVGADVNIRRKLVEPNNRCVWVVLWLLCRRCFRYNICLVLYNHRLWLMLVRLHVVVLFRCWFCIRLLPFRMFVFSLLLRLLLMGILLIFNVALFA